MHINLHPRSVNCTTCRLYKLQTIYRGCIARVTWCQENPRAHNLWWYDIALPRINTAESGLRPQMTEPDSGTTGASEAAVYPNNSREQSEIKNCKYYIGRDYSHRKCLAYGKTCNNSGKDHFSNVSNASSTSTGESKPVSAQKEHRKECIKCGKNNRYTSDYGFISRKTEDDWQKFCSIYRLWIYCLMPNHSYKERKLDVVKSMLLIYLIMLNSRKQKQASPQK